MIMSRNEERYRFCSCFTIMAVFRSGGMGWSEHIVCMGRGEMFRNERSGEI
jgi:hypothetical protein